MASNFKQKTPRDKAYLKWIDGQPCVICGIEETTHHHVYSNGMSLKCSDYDTLPVCCVCHDMIHRYYSKSSYWPEETLKQILATYKANYLKEKEK